MKAKLTLIAIAAASLTYGCSEWPPKKRFLVDNFYENRQDIEALKMRFEGSLFDEVYRASDRKVLGFTVASDLGEIDVEIPVEELRDSVAWASLFDQSNTESISSNERGGVSLNIPRDILGQRPPSIASYENGAKDRSALLPCEKNIAKARCGYCMVELDEDWWLRFGWWPIDLAEEEALAWKNGEMSDNEFWSLKDQIHRQCIAEGGTPIG